MKKVQSLFYNLIKYIILALFFIIILYLTYLAGFSTSFTNKDETTYLISDSIIINIIWVIITLIVGYFLYKKIAKTRDFIARVNSDNNFSLKCRRICLIIIGIVAFYFIIIVQNNPQADQYYVNEVANAWLEGDYSAFEPGKYVDRYPNQLGLIILLYCFAHIFGSYNYFIFQLCNIVALLFLYKAFAELSDFTGHSNFEGLMIIIGGGLFFPALLYASFIYGTLIGLSCSVNAMKRVVYFSDSHKVKDLIIASLLTFLAVIIKKNYLIFLIGLIILSVIFLIKNTDLKMALPIGLMVCILLTNVRIVNGITKCITGITPGHGMSNLAWVAMSLQENTSTPLYDGWWDGYTTQSYIQNNYDFKAQEKEANEFITERMQEFRSDPQMAVTFFSGKNASQWNNPDFEGIWINQAMSHNTVRYPYFMYDLFSVPGSARFSSITNRLQFILLFGVDL